jgi:hypothetical protein
MYIRSDLKRYTFYFSLQHQFKIVFIPINIHGVTIHILTTRIYVYVQSARYFCPILIKSEKYAPIIVKFANVKFN